MIGLWLEDPHSTCTTLEARKEVSHLGLSKDPPEPTHPLPPTEPDPPPTEPTAPAVGDGFHSLKSEINGSGIGSPPLKSEKPDPTDPSYSRRFLRFFLGRSGEFEFSFGIFKLDSARFR